MRHLGMSWTLEDDIDMYEWLLERTIVDVTDMIEMDVGYSFQRLQLDVMKLLETRQHALVGDVVKERHVGDQKDVGRAEVRDSRGLRRVMLEERR